MTKLFTWEQTKKLEFDEHEIPDELFNEIAPIIAMELNPHINTNVSFVG